MNVINTSYRTERARYLYDQGYGACVHVMNHFGVATDEYQGLCNEPDPKESREPYSMSLESDSFGPLDGHISCKVCHDEDQEREMSRIVECYDCKKGHPRRETISWKWFDFYAPQGDEPLIICNGCLELPKHKKRVDEDNADRRANRDLDY